MRVETKRHDGGRPPESHAPGVRRASGSEPPPRLVRIIGQVRFAPGSSILLPASRRLLVQYSAWLARATRGERFYIECEAGAGESKREVGGEDLGVARAEAVRRFVCARLRIPIDVVGIVPAGASMLAARDERQERGERGRAVVVLVLR